MRFLRLIFILCLCGYAVDARCEIRQVKVGEDLNAVFAAAKAGDELVLSASATYTGALDLKPRADGGIVTVRSSATLPERRITPADVGLFAIIRAGVNAPVIWGGPGVKGWKFDGIRFGDAAPNAGWQNGEAVVIEGGEDFTFDRILIIAPSTGLKRGIRGNGKTITLTRSHIEGVYAPGQDSQGFCAFNGAGPFVLRDNFIEAASENIMFGGANSASPENIPSDALVENNTLTKRDAWRKPGTGLNVKNLLEFKSCRRCTARGNTLSGNWSDGQNGYGILITVRNDEGQAPWSVVEDVLVEKNILKNTENGVNVLGYDSYQPSGRTTRVRVIDNDISVDWTAYQVGSEAGELTITGNRVTVLQDGKLLGMYPGDIWVATEKTPKRPARYAVEKFLFAGNTSNITAIHGDPVAGEGLGGGTSAGDWARVLNALTVSYSLSTSTVPPQVSLRIR